MHLGLFYALMYPGLPRKRLSGNPVNRDKGADGSLGYAGPLRIVGALPTPRKKLGLPISRNIGSPSFQEDLLAAVR